MNFKLRSLVAATLAGSMLMGFGVNAMADSTTDIVNALVAKGVLTEEEGALLTKGRVDEAAGQAKAIKKAGKLKVSDAIDSATLYGDIRVRYENRQSHNATPSAASELKLERPRYKVTLGVKTESGAWYSDLAMAMGSAGRSDNADFGQNIGTTTQGNINGKQAVWVKRAMVGYKATDWLTLEAGRMTSPLYSTPMVWDADLTIEGLSEQAKFKAGDADLSLIAVQNIYAGKRLTSGGVPKATTGTETYGSSEQLAFQAGARYAFNDSTSAKAAATYTTITRNPYKTNFAVGSTAVAAGGGTNLFSVNDLNTIDIPAEINYMATSNIGVRLFGDYVINTRADERATASKITGTSGGSTGSDDIAWMFGVAIGSAKDLKAFEGNKMAKGDWSARVWYQDVGAWSIDAAQVDSDIFDSRVNIKGTTFKAQYNMQDNLAVNVAAAHGKKKNAALYTFGSGDMSGDIKDFDLIQLDMTYKF